MRTVVESFKRLYESGKLQKEDIGTRVSTGVITTDEYQYITGEVYGE